MLAQITPTTKYPVMMQNARIYMLLLILINIDRPIQCKTLAELAGINEETTRGYLKSLARQHLITRIKPKSWLPTVAGRQMILPAVNAENPRLLPTTTTNYSIGKSEEVEVDLDKLTRKTRVNSKVNAENPRLLSPTILEAYNDCGIGLNNRTIRLSQQKHITPDYIRGHHAILSKRGQGTETGLLIYILESGQPLPVSKNDRHDPNYYISGEFADIIKH
jgi:hypothetical protein